MTRLGFHQSPFQTFTKAVANVIRTCFNNFWSKMTGKPVYQKYSKYSEPQTSDNLPKSNRTHSHKSKSYEDVHEHSKSSHVKDKIHNIFKKDDEEKKRAHHVSYLRKSLRRSR